MSVLVLIMQSYTIEDLEPFTPYDVSVAVRNSHGEGNFSDVVQNMTCEGGMKYCS